MLFALALFQVVLLSGHLDSWDVGQGAMDDGGGVAISWEALSLIRDLGETSKDGNIWRTSLSLRHVTKYLGSASDFDMHMRNVNFYDQFY